MALHLGWIPNEPGLRPREFGVPAPSVPDPDPAKVAALQAAQHARGLWTRLLIAIGLFALALFGFIGAVVHAGWAWAVAAAVAACCWGPAALLAWNRRRAAAGLRRATQEQARRHGAELAEYERGKAAWDRAETDRVAAAPRWLRVAAHEGVSRLDVFGGTPRARQSLLTGIGRALLAERAVIVLDLSQDRVGEPLVAAAAGAEISCRDYRLPRDLAATPLIDGLGADEIASLIVEVVHADDASATAAGRATDLMILRKVSRVLGARVTLARLHAALAALLGEESGLLSAAERAAVDGLFADGLRREVTGSLVRLAAVLEPLAALGAGAAGPPPPARLTCLSLPDGPRDVTADLTAALIVQWVTRALAAEGGSRPAIVLAGADEQSARHLGRLVTVCERHEIPLVRMFSRLTEESARHLDTRHTAFLRLATRAEALRAAEHIGLERRFVAGRFARRHSVSRSRTRTTGESVTHTAGRTEGGAVTHTTGTTTGQSYSEAEVPRQDRHVHVHLGDRDAAGDAPRSGRPDAREAAPGRDGQAGDDRRDEGASGAARRGQGPAAREAGAREAGAREAGARDAAGKVAAQTGGAGRGATERIAAGARPPRRGSGGGAGGRAGGGRDGRPAVDLVKTRTWFTARHESEAKTKSWSRTEENSHTSSRSTSRTDGVSVGDEISYELVYDHKVAPEALMALPEDQMLAPHIMEGQAGQGKMVALVIDPSVVGSAAEAPVRPDEIPAFEPPAPAISSHVPDYEQVPRPARGAD